MDGKEVSTNSDQLAPHSVKEPIDDPGQFVPISDEATGNPDPFVECCPPEEVLSGKGVVITERKDEEILIRGRLEGGEIVISSRRKIAKHETVRKRWKNLRRGRGVKS